MAKGSREWSRNKWSKKILATIGDNIAMANGINWLILSKIPHRISKDFSAINRYLNSNNAIASGLVAINGSSPKITKYPFIPATKKTTPKIIYLYA